MKTGFIFAAIVAVAALAFGIYMVDIEQTEETILPKIDVTVEGGNAPEFDAQIGDIETGTEEVTISVPTIDFQSPEEEAADNS